MAKRPLKNESGFAMSWVVVMLVVICLLALFSLTAGMTYSARSINSYSRYRAYLTARSAADAIASQIAGDKATVTGEGAPVFDTGLVPDAGKTLAVSDVSFGSEDANMGEIDSASIERLDNETIRVTANATSAERSSTVSVYLSLEKKQVSGGSGAGGIAGFPGGIYANTLHIANGATLTAGGDVYVSGQLDIKNRGSASISGDLYYGGTPPENAKIDGSVISPCPDASMSSDFIDKSEKFIGITDVPLSGLGFLDVLAWENVGSHYYIIKENGKTISDEFTVVGSTDTNGKIGNLSILTVGSAEEYYIFVPRGAELELRINNVGPVRNPKVYVILDGEDPFSDVPGSSFFGVNSGNAKLTVSHVDDALELNIYGAKGSRVEISDTHASFTGSILCDSLSVGKDFSFTAGSAGSSGAPVYEYTWETDRYAVE